MISKVIFKNIKFNNINPNKFNKYIVKNGLFVFPAGPALASIHKSKIYYNSLQKADFVFFDSGFLSLFFSYLQNNKKKTIFSIDPNLYFSKSNKLYLKSLGIKKVNNYLAPNYKIKNFSDKKLLKLLKEIKPNFIIVNMGGGIQEVLGLYLKKNLKFKVTILCTGGAISFCTGDQAPINNVIDK